MTERQRPRVILHAAVSLDGSTDGFTPDVARFYELAGTWDEDVTLAGSETILAQEPALADAPRPGPATGGPVLAVVDGQRRVRAWDALRECGHWSDAIGLFPEPGDRHVDLEAALESLAERYGAERIRVDSGGGLNGALLARGLVDEVSLLVHPVVSGAGRRWYGDEPRASALADLRAEDLPGGLVWLRGDVKG